MKKIASGMLLLIFSVVAIDMHASWKDFQTSLKNKVAATNQKIKNIKFKDVLKYTAGAAVITAVGILAILQYKTNKELLSRPSVQETYATPGIQALDTKVDGIQGSIGELGTKIKSHGLSSLIGITENIQALVAAILKDRQKSAKGEQTETTVTEVETEKKVDENLQKVEKNLGSVIKKLKNKKERVKEQKGKGKSKRKVF